MLIGKISTKLSRYKCYRYKKKYNTNYKNNGKYSPNTAKEGKFLTESTDIIIKPVNINKDRLFFIYIDYFMNLSPIVEINSKLVKSNIKYLRNKILTQK